MKLTKKFKGVLDGAIYPTLYSPGEVCPPELVSAAKAAGALGDVAKAPDTGANGITDNGSTIDPAVPEGGPVDGATEPVDPVGTELPEGAPADGVTDPAIMAEGGEPVADEGKPAVGSKKAKK